MTARSRTSTTVYSSTSTKRRPNRPVVKWLQTHNCIISLLLFLSSFERLEWMADKPLIDLHLFIPYSLLKLSILIDSYSQPLIYIALTLHILTIKLATAQAIMSELINYILWPILFVLNLSPFISNEDRLVYRMILNALAFVLSTSNLLAKRKSKLVKQHMLSNVKLQEPLSQLELYQSNRSTMSENSKWIDSDDDYAMSSSGSVVLPDLRERTPTRHSNREPTPTKKTREKTPLRRSTRERTPASREVTPFTELSGRLNTLSLNFGNEHYESPMKLPFNPPASQAPKMLSNKAITPSSQKKKSPFSSLKFHAISKQVNFY